jgi:hypothetical protein
VAERIADEEARASRPDRPRPEAAKGSRGDRGGQRPRPAPGPERSSGGPSRPAFNNPFAVLAKLKEPKKD